MDLATVSPIATRPSFNEFILSMRSNNADLRGELQRERDKVRNLQALVDRNDENKDYLIDQMSKLVLGCRELLVAASLPLPVLSDGNFNCGDVLEHVMMQTPRLRSRTNDQVTRATRATRESAIAKFLAKLSSKVTAHRHTIDNLHSRHEAECSSYESQIATLSRRLRATLKLLKHEVELKHEILNQAQIQSMDDIELAIDACMKQEVTLPAATPSKDALPNVVQHMSRCSVQEMYNLRNSALTQQEVDKKWYLRMMIREIEEHRVLGQSFRPISVILEHPDQTHLDSVACDDAPCDRVICGIRIDGHSPIGNPFHAQKTWQVQFESNCGDPKCPYISLTFQVNKADTSRSLSRNSKKTKALTLKLYLSSKKSFMLKEFRNLSHESLEIIPSHFVTKVTPHLRVKSWSGLHQVTLVGRLSSPMAYKRDVFDGLEEGVQANLDTLFHVGGYHTVDIWFVNPENSKCSIVDTTALSQFHRACIGATKSC